VHVDTKTWYLRDAKLGYFGRKFRPSGNRGHHTKRKIKYAFQGLFNEKKTLQNSIRARFTAKRVLETNCFVMEVERSF